MANEFLTKEDLLTLVKTILELVTQSTDRRVKLLGEKLIDNNQNEFISNEETKLLNEANKVANMTIGNIATDLKNSEAAKILQKTITDLEEVIEELEQFNIFIGIFAKLINVFSRISQVVAAGGGSVAIISSLVNDLIKLADPVVERGGLDSYIPGAI
jgi:hypothetical protein